MTEFERPADPIWGLLGLLFKPHPWHGVPIGSRAPEVVTAFIEMVPTDTVKYEIDKGSGYLKVDRPQKFSNVSPALYGFIPQTFCAERVAERTGRGGIVGDGDPLDICVLTEKQISHGDILLQAIPIGGLRMIEGNEADDKIIAVLKGDAAYGDWQDIGDCPPAMVERLRHYFLTYKEVPTWGESAAATPPLVEIAEVYGREEAHEVIRCSLEDYRARFRSMESLMPGAGRG